jgi:hypothetical protein
MRRIGWVLVAIAMYFFAGSSPAFGIEAGITLDVHQDIYNQAFWPNDFHIEGYVCSNSGIQPTLIDHLDDLFGVPPGTFNWTIVKLSGDPTDCWYWFEATWAFQPGTGYIPYCTVIHLGLLFDVDAANVIIDVIGWWTRDGMPVGRIIGSLQNDGYVPTVGFNIADAGTPQIATIANGLLPPLPPLPPIPLPPPPINPPPWPPQGIELWIQQADVIPFPPGSPPDFRELWEFGQQRTWPGWVPVTHNDGGVINPGRPLYWGIDSFFDIFLESAPPSGPGNLGVLSPFSIQPGGFLVARQLIGFFNNTTREYEQRWFWEVHGAQANEACCLPDGTCQDLLPFTCLQQGGTPMGPGSVCYPGLCLPKGACCYGTAPVQCIVVDPLTCQQQFFGQWKGPGTTCADLNGNQIADICESDQLGACCYGMTAPQCVVVDQLTCLQQYLGQWKGPGTSCADLNGNGIADICEEAHTPEACCLPDGTCLMLLPADCLMQGGTPKGPGSRCLGDLDQDGIDDLCEAKWCQWPDLSTNGVDVLASLPLVLADDFLCDKRTLITDLRIWGSWWNDILPPGGPQDVAFTLSIHADIPDPDGSGPAYSMPGPVLWLRHFAPGTFAVSQFQAQITEGWWDPRLPNYIPIGDHICWEYHFTIPAPDAFCQEGRPDAPIVYWLDVQAFPMPGGPEPAQFGWKTSINHWNDKAVWGQGSEPYPGPWTDLRYPVQHPLQNQSIDLAFALAGDLPCPAQCPTCRGDVNGDSSINGLDVECFIDCLLGGTIPSYCNCVCADMNRDNVVDMLDVPIFVDALLHKTGPCP